jgi:2-dehydropantoate 2-reductase
MSSALTTQPPHHPTTYHIVGAGGIGCALGYALRTAGVDVIFVESNPIKVEQGNRHGVAVAGRSPLQAQFIAFNDWSPPSDAVVLLCTKCYDNAAVLARISAGVRVVPVQNGVDPQLDAMHHAAEGIASFVSECEPDRPVTRITRPGALHIGGRGNGVPDWLPPLANALRAGGLFSVIEVPDVRPFKYAKLMYNAAISPLAAAAGIDNGKLLSDRRARRLFFALLRENYSILKNAGLPLARIGPFHPRTVKRILSVPGLARVMARAFEPSLRGTYCSMAGDIEKGRTEIDNYNGWLVQLAGERPCPMNRRAVEIVKRMTDERIVPNVEALDWFEPAQLARRG